MEKLEGNGGDVDELEPPKGPEMEQEAEEEDPEKHIIIHDPIVRLFRKPLGKKKEPRPVSVGHAPQIAEEGPPGDAAEEIRKDKAPPSTEGALTKVDNDDLGEEL